MPKGSLVRAGVVSLLFALVLPFLQLWAFGYGVVYNPPMNPDEFHRLAYEQQQAWLEENSTYLTGLKVVRSRVVDSLFWKSEYPKAALPLFLALYVACVAALAWERRVSSNHLSEPTL